ncbi:inositol monophosphatase 1-like [Lytechinus variegatus]|uniref:inositol monophosphatase 1-like n=1 Tax=Lytechinus variegatus TaxID=7654 RepID=UPI001BB16A71|nr:inositol monophosphatase 1-like [Lytechinus variegatus]
MADASPDLVKFDDEDVMNFLEAAVDVARLAGQKIKEAYLLEKRVEIKSSAADLVTETDQLVEKKIIGTLQEKFPDHCFIGEESVAAGQKIELTDAPTWIIDPVDGTTNFVHSFPFVAVCIGLAINKNLVAGVVYNAILDEMFTAIRGKGAYCNDAQIHCSGQEDIKQSLVMTEIGSSRKQEHIDAKLKNIEAIVKNGVHGVRSLGSAALNMCHVARGDSDLYVEYGIHCWDMAASAVILEEAGGVCADPKGGPLDIMSRQIICGSSQKLVDTVSQLLTHIDFERD